MRCSQCIRHRECLCQGLQDIIGKPESRILLGTFHLAGKHYPLRLFDITLFPILPFEQSIKSSSRALSDCLVELLE